MSTAGGSPNTGARPLSSMACIVWVIASARVATASLTVEGERGMGVTAQLDEEITTTSGAVSRLVHTADFAPAVLGTVTRGFGL